MFDHALSSSRLIGMIQPTNKDKDIKTDSPKIYKIGCAGIINAFSQTNDNRYEIVLKGFKKFKITSEYQSDKGFRIAKNARRKNKIPNGASHSISKWPTCKEIY